jgi:hypothetical protein
VQRRNQAWRAGRSTGITPFSHYEAVTIQAHHCSGKQRSKTR